jgi:hypothetical protein
MATSCQFGMFMIKLLLVLQVATTASKWAPRSTSIPAISLGGSKQLGINGRRVVACRGGAIPVTNSKTSSPTVMNKTQAVSRISTRKLMRLGGWGIEEAQSGLEKAHGNILLANDLLAKREECEIGLAKTEGLKQLIDEGYDEVDILNALRENIYNIVRGALSDSTLIPFHFSFLLYRLYTLIIFTWGGVCFD